MSERNIEQAEGGEFGDGLSLWTHRAAKSRQVRGSNTRTMTLRARILQQENAFRELKIRFDRSSATERPYLSKQLGIKAQWLAKLWKELGEKKR
jgi:hypothetical protein